jgi:hypothetical protein
VTRVAVFIDYQNVYKGARAAFGWKNDPDFTKGQVFPRRLALLCTDRGRALDADRQLAYVMVFSWGTLGNSQPTWAGRSTETGVVLGCTDCRSAGHPPAQVLRGT